MNPRIVPGAEPFSFDGGPTGILLIHGYTGNPISVRAWGESLAARGYAVLCPRLPGHGTTWQDLAARHAHEWVEEVDEALTSLRERCGDVVACALSFGSALALHLAATRPDDVRGVATVNPYVRDRRHALIPVARLFVRTVRGTRNDIKRPAQDEMAYTRIPLSATAEVARFLKQVQRELPAVRAPVLLFHAPQDHVVPKGTVEFLMGSLGSERKELVLLPDSYHVATMDNDAETIFEKTHEFVASLVRA